MLAAGCLWAGFTYAHRVGPEMFPGLGRILADPAEFDGHTVWFYHRIVDIRPDRFQVATSSNLRIWIVAPLQREHLGAHAVLRGKFNAAKGVIIPEIHTLRLVRNFFWQRGTNYVISFLAMVWLIRLCLRTFAFPDMAALLVRERDRA